MAGTKMSALSAITSIKTGTKADFLVTTTEGSKRISYDNLLASMAGQIGAGKEGVYPFSSAVELSYSWADIKAMCADGDFQDIRVGDFKTIQVGSDTCVMQVAGMDTHYRCGDFENTHHIDFISRDCLSDTIAWNTSAANNGNATQKCPYMISNVHSFLTGTVYNRLPTDVKNVIVDRRELLEERYAASGAQTSDTGWSWQSIGKLWLPNEVEVYGREVWAGPYSAGTGTQYPLFRGGWATRVKGKGHNGSRYAWWLRSVRAGSSTNACYVDGYGHPNSNAVTGLICVPLCFRIA